MIRKTRSEYVLYISQSLNDIQVLYKIKKLVGFGKIRIQQKEAMANYVLQKKEGLKKVLNLLSGKFIGEKLKKYMEFLKFFSMVMVQPEITVDFISLENG
jgi:hypothetical protein